MNRRRNPSPSRFLERVIDNGDDPLTISWVDAAHEGESGDHDAWVLELGGYNYSPYAEMALHHHRVYWDRGRWLISWEGKGRSFGVKSVRLLVRGDEIKMTDDEYRRLGIHGFMVATQMVERMHEVMAKSR